MSNPKESLAHLEEPPIDIEELSENDFEGIRKDFIQEKEQSDDLHFKRIIPEELMEEDLRIWYRYRKGILSEEEFSDYNQQFLPQKSKNILDSRIHFAAMILNKLIAEQAGKRLAAKSGISKKAA